MPSVYLIYRWRFYLKGGKCYYICNILSRNAEDKTFCLTNRLELGDVYSETTNDRMPLMPLNIKYQYKYKLPIP